MGPVLSGGETDLKLEERVVDHRSQVAGKASIDVRAKHSRAWGQMIARSNPALRSKRDWCFHRNDPAWPVELVDCVAANIRPGFVTLGRPLRRTARVRLRGPRSQALPGRPLRRLATTSDEKSGLGEEFQFAFQFCKALVDDRDYLVDLLSSDDQGWVETKVIPTLPVRRSTTGSCGEPLL